MDLRSKDQLLKRVARLARQNKELEEQAKKLSGKGIRSWI